MSEFAVFVEKERHRILKAKAEVTARITKLNQELAKYEIEFEAITAYERAKKAGSMRPRRSRDMTKRTRVLSYIQSRAGVSRGDVILHFGIKGNKKQEHVVSTLLSNLKKAGLIRSVDGKYIRA